MSAIVLTNAMLVDIDPPHVQRGELRTDDGKIIAHGPTIERMTTDEVVDCGGAVVIPGWVNGHTHVYSALALGMPPPVVAPTNFMEILEFVWWRLDRALDDVAIEMSARIGALDALKCGTTTLIDHHASPNCIANSLDAIERSIQEIGLRGVLCYETTDRHGTAGRLAGLLENRRYIDSCQGRKDGHFAALIGAHASFTLGDETLISLAELSRSTGTGLHIHVAEDPCDESDCRRRYGLGLIERLDGVGLLKRDTVLAHGTHLSCEDIETINSVGLTLAHNTRSNMNNAVGYAPVGEFKCPVMLGTDGIGGDLFAEAQAAWFKSRDGGAGIGPQRVLEMLSASARRASQALGVILGQLRVGAAADVVVTDYVPSTPLTPENLAGHIIFGMGSRNVRHVMIDGQWVLRDRSPVRCDERDVRARSNEVAREVWQRMD